MITIQVKPYTVGSPSFPKVGTQFQVRYINYSAPTAVADCHLLNDQGLEIMTVGLIAATPAQTEAWTDDDAFAGAIAVNAGFELDPDRPKPVLPTPASLIFPPPAPPAETPPIVTPPAVTPPPVTPTS
jgi:hypothetical protein